MPLNGCIRPSTQKPTPTGLKADLVSEPELVGEASMRSSEGTTTW